MRWLIFVGFTFSIYTILVLIANFLAKYGIHISQMGIGAVGGILSADFFNWLCKSNIGLTKEEISERILVDKQAYFSTLDCTMNYWNEIEKKTDKIKELDNSLEKADKILKTILEKTTNKQLKQLIKNYLNEKR